MQLLICQSCKNEFISPRTNYKNPYRFCSKACSAKNKTKHVLKECIQCKTMTKNPKFCSRSCSASYNNKFFPKKVSKKKPPAKIKPFLTPEQKYKKRRQQMNEANARYRARVKYQTPVDENLHEIKLFYENCPAGYEVDHIIPISKGGPHSFCNLQYLTKSENRRKSNKI